MQTVLIVDDEEEIRNMLKTYLKREGVNVISCSNGAEALDVVAKQEIHLILLDIMMDGLDGFEVLQRLREMHEQIPVIFLSARQEEYDKVLGLGLGADDYVTKPFSPGELMARVKVQLRRGQKQSDSDRKILQYGEISMDLNSYQVSVNDRQVELAGKELLLLKFFLEHPGQVFTKTQIYHQVWEEGYEDDKYGHGIYQPSEREVRGKS